MAQSQEVSKSTIYNPIQPHITEYQFPHVVCGHCR